MPNPEQASQLPLFVTIADAALLSSTSESTIRRMIKNGTLGVTYFSSSPRISTQELLQHRPRPVQG